MKQKGYGLEFQVALAIFGFFLLGCLSLGAGNTVMTSIERGAAGLFGFYLVGYLLRLAFRLFVNQPSQQEDLRGNHIDLLLTDEQQQETKTTSETAQDEFVPLVEILKTSPEDLLKNQDPRLIAEALRHLDE